MQERNGFLLFPPKVRLYLKSKTKQSLLAKFQELKKGKEGRQGKEGFLFLHFQLPF